MPYDKHSDVGSYWPPLASAALRVAFGLVWAVDAALAWTPGFAHHFVGYLHNAAAGQAAWSAWWFDMWIAIVTPHAGVFILLTRLAETALALALLLGFARKSTYLAGALFSLLIWSTAEGFGGPYAVGASNMGVGIVYVLVFLALLSINRRSGLSLYSLDHWIEKHWPFWRRFAEWSVSAEPRYVVVAPWRTRIAVLGGVVVLAFFLIAGMHSSLNVTPASPKAAAAAVSPLTLASSDPVKKARDARLPPVAKGNTANVRIVVTDDDVTIASGVQYKAWTFNKEVPGPTIHVRQGQTVHVTLINHGTMQHSIDFHAAQTPPNLDYADIMPGEKIEFSFVAKVPGAFLYHCGTAPLVLHIANGMYGALIVDPVDHPLPPADKSYVLVEGEWYTQQVSGHLMAGDYQKMLKVQPDEVVFNGIAGQYADHPLQAEVNKRVRLYVVNAGPNLWSAFHVVGAIFDKVYPDGNPAHALSGLQTFSVAPGDGAVFDLMIPEAGHYTFVNHRASTIAKGAHGILNVTNPNATTTPKPPISKAARPRLTEKPQTAVAAGSYHFDGKKGASLYQANCAACHQASGKGLPGAFPPLKGNPAVLDDNPSKHIDVVLHGLHGEAIDGVSYSAAMPPFGSRLSDTEIADIINHERTSWKNDGKLVTAKEVSARRNEN